MKYGNQLAHPTTITTLAALLCLLAFTVWYQGFQDPLSTDEVDAYIQRIAANQAATEAPFDLQGLQQFLSEDDGKAFYMVNLIRFHDRADYGDGRQSELSGREAQDLFAAGIMPALLKRGSHPAFGGSGLHPHFADWDSFGIVRYRSRRDLADFFASTEFARASVHRDAGIQQRIHLPVRGVDLSSPTTMLLGVLMLTIMLVHGVVYWRRSNAAKAITG